MPCRVRQGVARQGPSFISAVLAERGHVTGSGKPHVASAIQKMLGRCRSRRASARGWEGCFRRAASACGCRNQGLSLRAIAEETNLGLNTIRTIIDQRDQCDRTSVNHLERVRRDMG